MIIHIPPFRFLLLAFIVALGVMACESGSSAKVNTASSKASTLNNGILADKVLIQGSVTFDQIPKDTQGKLQFKHIYPAPVRQAQIDAVSVDGTVLYSSVTSKTGAYALLVPDNISMYLRVWARIQDTDSAKWQAKVVDNTQNNAEYALTSAIFNSATAQREVNVHAASGRDDGTYESLRASAPFAILDALYEGFTLVDAELPELSVAWSVDNSTAGESGKNENAISQGFLGSSFYSTQDGTPKIYLLGNINNDADEYDRSVILHEFGHFIMDKLSRSDSVGGGYSPGAKLDLRVSFNEAISNVFAAIIDDQPLYADVFGSQQGLVQTFDLEVHNSEVKGWYSTEALSWLIYDAVDQNSDESDQVALGWEGLLNIITNPDVVFFEGVMSIYPFLFVAKDLYPEAADALDALANRHHISSTDAFGLTETDNGGNKITLPLYNKYTFEGPLNVCSQARITDFNGLDVHRLVQFEITNSGTFNIAAVRKGGGLQTTSPDFVVYQNGKSKLRAYSEVSNTAKTSHFFEAGQYILDIFERSNADNNPTNGGLACFDISITPGELNNAPLSPDCSNLASLVGDSRCQYAQPNSTGSIAL